MTAQSDTRWGREFEGLPPGEQAADPWNGATDILAAGQWSDAIQALSSCYAADPIRGVEATELAGCAHLARDGDLRGAVARARFALGEIADPSAWDALARALCESLMQRGDEPWAALALLGHSKGPAHLAEQIQSGALTEQWLKQDGLDALETLVFDRADETGDPGWMALSAMLGARDPDHEFDEQMLLHAAERQGNDNPRAWGVELHVLFLLDHDDAAATVVSQALETFATRPRALLEILDAVSMDADLEPLLSKVAAHEPNWVAHRAPTDAPAEAIVEGHDALSALSAAASFVKRKPFKVPEVPRPLPEPPRRTDADWLERKAAGDQAFAFWLRNVIAGGLFLAGLAAAFYRSLG
ncbi:MAG: hypothetical protein AAGA54_33425 [Myxococcota bacterium]